MVAMVENKLLPSSVLVVSQPRPRELPRMLRVEENDGKFRVPNHNIPGTYTPCSNSSLRITENEMTPVGPTTATWTCITPQGSQCNTNFFAIII